MPDAASLKIKSRAESPSHYRPPLPPASPTPPVDPTLDPHHPHWVGRAKFTKEPEPGDLALTAPLADPCWFIVAAPEAPPARVLPEFHGFGPTEEEDSRFGVDASASMLDWDQQPKKPCVDRTVEPAVAQTCWVLQCQEEGGKLREHGGRRLRD